MNTLVLIECHYDDNHSLVVADATAATINAARELGNPIHALIIGHGLADCAGHVATIAGVDCVYCLDAQAYEYALPEVFAPIITRMMQSNAGYSHLLTAATGVGKNILPRVAALLDVMQVSEVTKIIAADTFEHFIYAGSAVETVQSLQPQHVLTIRTTSFCADADIQEACAIELLDATDVPEINHTLSQVVSVDVAIDDGAPDLSSAKTVVAGGGGLSHEDFDTLLKPLAQQLKAAIGASRVPVANGYCGSDALVGQTGKAVAPALYIAVGISGANQHIAGMKEAQMVVAINKDETAPIFNYADYGIVGDARMILPELSQQLAAIGS